MNKMWWVFTLPPDELTRLSTTRITDDHPRKSHSEGKKWKQTIVEGCFSLPCCRIITTISHVSFQYIESLSNPQPPPKGWKFTFFQVQLLLVVYSRHVFPSSTFSSSSSNIKTKENSENVEWDDQKRISMDFLCIT